MMERMKSWNSSGAAYPTVSGRFTTDAPAAIAASTTLHRKSASVREASSAENSTSAHFLRAYATMRFTRSSASRRDMWSLLFRCRSLVARNVCTRGCAASLTASAAASMSFSSARASDATVQPFTARAIWRTLSKSPGEATANPASITSTPSDSSWSAMRVFSSCDME